jgi:hypothetical protein
MRKTGVANRADRAHFLLATNPVRGAVIGWLSPREIYETYQRVEIASGWQRRLLAGNRIWAWNLIRPA